ncbi:MAG TPA: hypothetical protein DEO84_04035 [candidate division Zixibacteria bacterium]|nr:hypothetical protein [candidate division Zixibacteria bacterium]
MKKVIVLLMVMIMVAAVSAATIEGSSATPKILDNVMFQDFESPAGWNASDPPSGWTILDYGLADGTWDSYDWSKYSAWGGGTARVSGASANRYNNDWMITPAIDFGEASACSLFYRHYYDDYLTQSADSALVLLSNDNGDTWGDTIVVYSGADYGSDAVPDSEYFNISAFAAGFSQVKLAFQYVKRQAVLTGSWRIDNVRMFADGYVVFSEPFDTGWGPYGDIPPAGWTILDVQVSRLDDNDWHQANIADWGNVARVFWSPVEQQNELLISPSMDFSDHTNNLHLSLKQWYEDITDARDTAFILGSINGGSTWPETLATYFGADHGSLSNPAHDTLNILNWANDQTNVVIGFKYVGNNDGRWYIDSVNVDRIDMFSNDVRVNSISSPSETTIVGYSWPVSAVVKNVGIYSATFDVVYQIFDSIGAVVYSDTEAVSLLPSLTERTVDFAPWHAGEANNHDFRCFTRMFVDLDHSNDTLYSSTTTFPHVGHAGPVEGWSFDDNISGDGLPYNWVNIQSTGTQISFSDPDDGNSGMIEMGMDFDYFGQTYTRVAVSTNGWLSFEDSTGTDSSPSIIPDIDGPSAMIALLWSDLKLGIGHVYYRHDVPTNRFIVQYDSVEYVSLPGSYIGMEAIFNDNNNSISLQYRFFTGGLQTAVVIGVENQAQDAGLPYDDNGQIGQTPQAGLAITYTYLPPHDVKALAVIQPRDLICNGESYDIVASVLNVGANTESFEVTAYDDHGYSNTQAVIELGSLDTATVTFPGWDINSQCETYSVNVFCNLGEDSNRANDTTGITLESTPAANLNYIYDDGAMYLGYTLGDTTDVMASKFGCSYENSIISAVAYKFVNTDENPDDQNPDTALVSIFIDDDSDGLPDAQPIYSRQIIVAKSGWTVWNIGCDTNLVVDCKNIWAGMSVIDSASAGLGVDRTLDQAGAKWVREYGQWYLISGYYGDFMIRAFIQADTTTQPEISLGSRHIVGAAQPHGIDTVTTFIENVGIGCSLGYQVSVVQSAQRILSKPNNDLPIITRQDGRPDVIDMKRSRGIVNDPPRLMNSGGPDIFGYTWVDSDDPEGPDFTWIEISETGTPVTWTHGDSDDGYTDAIPMGMAFNFYGINYSSVVISTNGWVSFRPLPEDDGLAHSGNSQIPNTEFNTLLAPEWDNLTGGTSGHCYYYGDAVANAFIISWEGWSYAPGQTGAHNFEIIIDCLRGTIQYQYGPGTYESDITVGIQNSDGSDGLQVAYDQSYLHSSLAVLFEPPIFWLSTDLVNAVLPSGSGPFPFKIFMNSAGLPGGSYNGAIVITSTDIHEPVAVIDVQFEIEGVCSYVPGDVNGSGNATGLDVVYMVNFFHGGRAPHDECPPCRDLGTNMIYPPGDVNGTCSWTGLDVTYFVRYLKGIGPALRFCPQCPPGGRILSAPERIKAALESK